MGKYQPLSDRLSDHPQPEWRASFAEIEEVLGFPLPKAARRRAWWSPENARSEAWTEHGWLVVEFDPGTGEVTFRKSVSEPALQGASAAAVARPGKQPLDMKVGAQVASVVSQAPKWGLAAAIAGGVAVLGVIGGMLLRGKRRNPTGNS